MRASRVVPRNIRFVFAYSRGEAFYLAPHEEEVLSMAINPYNPKEIEPKWQKKWADSHAFEAEASHDKPKFYGLIEFPYPSGHGLHVGHPRSNTASDIIARKRRMQG